MIVLFEKEFRRFDFFEIIGVKGLSFDMKGFIADLSAHTSMSLLGRLQKVIFESREHIFCNLVIEIR